MQAPILLIVFNRPETTARVFESIRNVKPKKLYISADAPRCGNTDDINLCKLTRDIVSDVDWDCDVNYRFLDINLGCGLGPASAISWAFENEEKLIILEDDCVPSKAFFDYCNHCLDKYFSDNRVWIVSGRSHHEGSVFFSNQDYIFSHYGHTWGWATWKRCWDNFDIEMKIWDDFRETGGFCNVFFSHEEAKYYNFLYNRLSNDVNLRNHVWDYQHFFGVLVNGGISITPSKNLVQNIGIEGTHTNGELKCHLLKASEDYKIIQEPPVVLANRSYDIMHFNTHINPKVSVIRKMSKGLIRLFNKHD